MRALESEHRPQGRPATSGRFDVNQPSRSIPPSIARRRVGFRNNCRLGIVQQTCRRPASGDIRAAFRQRRPQARRLSREAAADRSHVAPAAARDAVRGLQRRPDHAQRRLLRALSQRGDSDLGRRRQARDQDRRQRRGQAGRHHHGRSEDAVQAGRDHGRQPVLGNSRALFMPRVTGGQLGNGAMGNARWVGVPLKDVLRQGRDRNTARQVTFNGLDNGVIGGGDFVKALDVGQATDPDVIVAYQMNGADIPMLNGYPVKLVVPGYYGTYWVKHSREINVVDQRSKSSG